eukprot:TRINITY_DN22746_c0_g1_i1.p1 TRINITY_DN22746_c0_g1~~TRINITY_DN22746_c0_g1_i1.p1  ORF type:complete len:134 (+),score=21.68 TRINITY_DN22746_c0_g1_i1:2-403(+)
MFLGRPMPKEEARQMIMDADVNGDGTIDFEEFRELVEHKARPETGLEDLRLAFKLFECKDSPGFITLSSMRDVCDHIGESVTDDRLQEMLNLVGNGDGLVDYMGFVRSQTLLQQLDEIERENANTGLDEQAVG